MGHAKKIILLGLGAFALTLSSCATMFQQTPTLTKWRDQEFTLCCAYCNAAEWKKGVTHHCTGKTKQIGGERYEKVSGYETKRTKKGDSEEVETRPQVHREECRVYTCQGEVRPDPIQ